MQLYLNFHGHFILVSSTEDSLIGKLKEEFHYFVEDGADTVQTTIDLMILGMGLPQVIKIFFLFNITDVFKIFYHGLLRTICAIQLLRRSTLAGADV